MAAVTICSDFALPMRLNPTRSGDLERKAGEKELENREAQRGAGEEAGDERDVRVSSRTHELKCIW